MTETGTETETETGAKAETEDVPAVLVEEEEEKHTKRDPTNVSVGEEDGKKEESHDCDCEIGEGEERMCSWMYKLREEIGQKALTQVKLPGTHDSATRNCLTTSSIAANAPGDLHKKGFLHNSVVKSVISRWAITQTRSISQQLSDGIRYFDLRVCWHSSSRSLSSSSPSPSPSPWVSSSSLSSSSSSSSQSIPSAEELGGDLFTCHSLISDRMEDLLVEIRAFVQSHSHETIILDFNHFYSMTVEHHRRLIRLLRHYLAPHMFSKELPLTAPLCDRWSRKERVLVLYKDRNEDKTTKETRQYLQRKMERKQFLWPMSSISSKWINTICPVKLKSGLANALELRKDHPEKHNVLHVSQAILTPVTSTITKSLVPGAKHKNLEEMARDIYRPVLQWIEDEWHDKDLNIVIIDHYKPCFVKSLVQLNTTITRSSSSSSTSSSSSSLS